jgi:hypothetical protein
MLWEHGPRPACAGVTRRHSGVVPPAAARAAADRRVERPRADGAAACRPGAPRAPEVQALSQRLADGICTSLGVASVRVRVALRRPPLRGGELQGLYTPANGRGHDLVTVWMLTAKRGQVVAYRTFLRTFLHELCHHLDYTLLHLRDSLHTQGFYQRESSLFHALDAGSVDGRG